MNNITMLLLLITIMFASIVHAERNYSQLIYNNIESKEIKMKLASFRAFDIHDGTLIAGLVENNNGNLENALIFLDNNFNLIRAEGHNYDSISDIHVVNSTITIIGTIDQRVILSKYDLQLNMISSVEISEGYRIDGLIYDDQHVYIVVRQMQNTLSQMKLLKLNVNGVVSKAIDISENSEIHNTIISVKDNRIHIVKPIVNESKCETYGSFRQCGIDYLIQIFDKELNELIRISINPIDYLNDQKVIHCNASLEIYETFRSDNIIKKIVLHKIGEDGKIEMHEIKLEQEKVSEVIDMTCQDRNLYILVEDAKILNLISMNDKSKIMSNIKLHDSQDIGDHDILINENGLTILYQTHDSLMIENINFENMDAYR